METVEEIISRQYKTISNTWIWKGGKTKNRKGYILVYYPDHPFALCNGYVYEHRLVMEYHLERYLKKGEVIHHLNNDGMDNRIENLQLCSSQTEHQYIHRPKGRICPRCNNREARSKTRYRKWTRNPLNKNQILCESCYVYTKRRTRQGLSLDYSINSA